MRFHLDAREAKQLNAVNSIQNEAGKRGTKKGKQIRMLFTALPGS